MSRGPDIIRWVIDWMMTNEQAVTEELALRCEREARREWGGQSIPYVAKQSSADRQRRVQEARLLLERGVPMEETARHLGTSRQALAYALRAARATDGASNSTIGDQRASISLGESQRFGASGKKSP